MRDEPKIAADAAWLTGKLYLASSGWLMLSVPNELGRGLFRTLNEPGIELPTHDGQYNAHISVLNPEEVARVGGPEKLKFDRGKEYYYQLSGVESGVPKSKGWSRVWYAAVHSPDLVKLRRSLGLTDRMYGGDWPFHITVAVRKTNVLGRDVTATKLAPTGADAPQSLDAEDARTTRVAKAAADLAAILATPSQGGATDGRHPDGGLRGMGTVAAFCAEVLGPRAAGMSKAAGEAPAAGPGHGGGGRPADPPAPDVTYTDWLDESEKARPLQRLDAHAAGKNVGFLTRHPASEGDGVWIKGMYVDPAHRGQGIAKELMSRTIAAHPGQNLRLRAKPFRDEPLTADQLAAFYAKFGFKPVDDEHRMLRPGAAPEVFTALGDLFEQIRNGGTKAAADPSETKAGPGRFITIAEVRNGRCMSDEEIEAWNAEHAEELESWRAGNRFKKARDFVPGEDCPNCNASLERSEDGYCNSCGASWPKCPACDSTATNRTRGVGYTSACSDCGHKFTDPDCNKQYGREKKAAVPFKARLLEALKNVGKPTSDAQREAGNYAMGHCRIHGLAVTISCKKGQRRKPDWPPLKAHYGHIRGFKGADGDNFDVFVADEPDAGLVFVVDQLDAEGDFDEHKAIAGVPTKADARRLYLDHYPAKFFGGISALTVEQFKEFLRDGDVSKPVAGQVHALKAAADAGPAAGGDKITQLILAAIDPQVTRWAKEHGYVRGDFEGGRNLLDQAEDATFRARLAEAMGGAAQADRPRHEALLKGLATLGGVEWTPELAAKAGQASGGLAAVAPHFQRWAPDLWDDAHGAQGSVAALTHAIAEANRHRGLDPVEAAAQAERVFGELYDGDPMKTRGFGAKEMGGIYAGLVRRGVIPRGAKPAEVAAALAEHAGPLSAVRDSLAARVGDRTPVPVDALFPLYDRARREAPGLRPAEFETDLRAGDYVYRQGHAAPRPAAPPAPRPVPPPAAPEPPRQAAPPAVPQAPAFEPPAPPRPPAPEAPAFEPPAPPAAPQSAAPAIPDVLRQAHTRFLTARQPAPPAAPLDPPPFEHPPGYNALGASGPTGTPGLAGPPSEPFPQPQPGTPFQ
jgi:GNAT superfamily N-acetyltransferase